MRLRGALASALAIACYVTASHASGAWLAKGDVTPLVERVAISASGTRTTTWTSLRMEATAKATVGIVLPLAPGSTVARSSDAWFEALEVATAPRVFPPEGVTAVCPGQTKPKHAFDIAGDTEHQATLPPDEVAVVADLDAVLGWASAHQLV